MLAGEHQKLSTATKTRKIDSCCDFHLPYEPVEALVSQYDTALISLVLAAAAALGRTFVARGEQCRVLPAVLRRGGGGARGRSHRERVDLLEVVDDLAE